MQMIKLKPYCHKAIWGGNNLYLKYGKTDFPDIAESWELSGYPGKESTAADGEFKGETITEIISRKGKRILGKKAEGYNKFPLLIKFIDAASPLSIQVHPSDEMAELLDADGGKTEMWIVCDCEKNSFLYFGVKEPISKEKLRDAILDGTITEYLNKIYVKPGDTFFISAGTIHAIGAGITICEIQQTSDTTYRLYDYKRVDANGKERELHLEKGILASSLVPPEHFYEKGVKSGDELKLVSCPFFSVSSINVSGSATVFSDDESFIAITVTDGSGEIINSGDCIGVSKGDTVFIFAGAGKIDLKGNFNIVKSSL